MKLGLPLFAVALLAGCNSGPTGTYHLDKEGTEAVFKSEAPGTNVYGFVNTDLKMVLGKDGTYERTITFGAMTMNGSAKQTETEKGTWTSEGDAVELKSGDRRVSCSVQPDGLSCKSDDFVKPITEGRVSRIVLRSLGR